MTRTGRREGKQRAMVLVRATDNVLLSIFRYLQPYLEEVIRERKEREEWAKQA